MEHSFVYNYRGWNKKFVDGRWVDVELIDGSPIYLRGDLKTLFRPLMTLEEVGVYAAIETLIFELRALIAASDYEGAFDNY